MVGLLALFLYWFVWGLRNPDKKIDQPRKKLTGQAWVADRFNLLSVAILCLAAIFAGLLYFLGIYARALH